MDGKIVSANALLLEVTGFSSSKLLGEPLERVFGMAGNVLYQSYLLPLLKTQGRVEGVNLDLRLLSGKYVSATIGAFLMPSEGVDFVRLAIMPTQRQAEIAGELTRIRRAAEQVPGTLFQLVIPKAGRPYLPYMSESVRQMYGITPSAARDSIDSLFLQVIPADRQLLSDAFLRPKSLDGNCTHIFRIKRGEENERWHEVTARSSMMSDGSLVWHGYIADVSERKQAEALSASLEAARIASVAKSTFLARVSHELRTPLNAIIGFSDLLHRAPSIQQDPKILTRLGYVLGAGRHLLAMVDDLLDIARVESGNLQVTSTSVNLTELVASCVQNAESMAQHKEVVIETASPTSPIFVQADPTRARQIVANLLSNAIKYNRPKGLVRVVISDSTDRASVAVNDWGTGLSREQLDSLFQPFNRLGADKGSSEGTGLGLVISKQLAEAMGGSIEVESEQGRGSTFTVYFPATSTAASPEEPDSTESVPAGGIPDRTSTAPHQGQSFSLLYIEDEATNLELVRQVVEGRPEISLIEALDGAAGVRLAEVCKPHLILLDIGLPGMDGFQVLAALKRRESTASIPVIACSANAMTSDIERALASGFAGYLTKPLDVSTLISRIESFLPRQE